MHRQQHKEEEKLCIKTNKKDIIRMNHILLFLDASHTVERRLSERQSSETSNIWTHIFFILRSNNKKSAITSHNKVLCYFY